MKMKQKKKMMFGDLTTPAPKNRDAGPDRLVIDSRSVVFRKQPHFSISPAKGKFV
jgi:hypothetical protein